MVGGSITSQNLELGPNSWAPISHWEADHWSHTGVYTSKYFKFIEEKHIDGLANSLARPPTTCAACQRVMGLQNNDKRHHVFETTPFPLAGRGSHLREWVPQVRQSPTAPTVVSHPHLPAPVRTLLCHCGRAAPRPVQPRVTPPLSDDQAHGFAVSSAAHYIIMQYNSTYPDWGLCVGHPEGPSRLLPILPLSSKGLVGAATRPVWRMADTWPCGCGPRRNPRLTPRPASGEGPSAVSVQPNDSLSTVHCYARSGPQRDAFIQSTTDVVSPTPRDDEAPPN